ncbi:MAG: class I SAM-dependent methyltransferase [Pseudomonadota bacterium]|nr:class I SAM-dependent methyltransferase [Pseudomonadota bacterium]
MKSKGNRNDRFSDDKIGFGFRQVRPELHESLVRDVFDSVAQRYDLMNDIMSIGLHRRWKATLLDRLIPRQNQTLLDVAGGTGDIADGFLKRGGSNAILCDFSEQMLQAGIDRALNHGRIVSQNRVCGEAATLPIKSMSVDACTIVFGLRNITRRRAALKEMWRTLKPGGHFLCLEFSPSVLPHLRPAYDAYSFKVLPWLGQHMAGDRDSYQYLAESIREFPGPDRISDEMRAAGFGNITQNPMTGGIVWLHSGWRV